MDTDKSNEFFQALGALKLCGICQTDKVSKESLYFTMDRPQPDLPPGYEISDHGFGIMPICGPCYQSWHKYVRSSDAGWTRWKTFRKAQLGID